MKLSSAIVAVALLTGSAVAPALVPVAAAQENQSRSVTGTVTGANDQPVKEAVVYLKNMKTLAIKSYISEPNGAFRFLQLSPNVDYQVWADDQASGAKSSVKTISSFDSRRSYIVNLKIEK